MESKLKHLDYIQAVIARMAANSFLIKGWSVTLVSALLALSAKDGQIRFVLVSYFAIISFWLLDGFFLSAERRYRELYSRVAGLDPAHIDFSMDASGFNNGDATWCSGIFSKTLGLFYGTLIAISLVVMLVFPHI